MSQITVDKVICWSCMKQIETKKYISMMGGEYTVYKLGDCCKELSTEDIHTPEVEPRHAV